MQRLAVGMIVRDVRGMTAGTIRVLRSCCFEVEGYRFHMNLTGSSIFNVESDQATLMCDGVECSRYACPIHEVESAANSPRLVARDRTS